MQIVKYPLASSNWTEEEYEAINEIVKSGQFTMGKKVRCFERKFAEYLGVKHAVMVNSGSSANLIAFQSLLYKTKNPLKAGDSVIVPAVGWSTTYFPLHQSGLKLKFVDIDQRTFNIDLEQVERAAEDPNVKAICAVNLLGRSCQFDRLLEIADKNDLVILEDNCEGFGASFNQKKTGTFGLCGTHSFFFSHHLVTMEGGMAVTNDDEIYDIMLCLRAHGWTRELPKNSHLQIKGSEFTKKFRFVLPGYNLRPLEMEAAIGLIQLEKVESM
jgi:CDP-6-deoxy-D-xylo-4-hexulose-3-dehydrase